MSTTAFLHDTHASRGPGTDIEHRRVVKDRTTASACTFRCVLNRLRFTRRQSKDVSTRSYSRLPLPSQDRLEASLNELPVDIEDRQALGSLREKQKTVLYLAYGSNLCNETFRGVRGIRPISQVNVVVPELKLTFDLPGLPYSEPCFANSAVRRPSQAHAGGLKDEEYHKDRWHKGMVGCVYEVTASDFAHILATEGGGASYNDVLVTCYPLVDGESVPETPTTTAFKAHTLFAPAAEEPAYSIRAVNRVARPDPSYAQPSARYLNLITTGAAELSLPAEYQVYLRQIRPYTITSRRQAIGQKVFMGVWAPFFALLLGLSKVFQDDKGRTPHWLATLFGWFFLGMWSSYDGVFKKLFGDGERTEGMGEDAFARRRESGRRRQSLA